MSQTREYLRPQRKSIENQKSVKKSMSNQSLIIKPKNDSVPFEKPRQKQPEPTVEEHSGELADFIDVYETHINNLISVTRSDLRNIKQIKSGQIEQSELL